MDELTAACRRPCARWCSARSDRAGRERLQVDHDRQLVDEVNDDVADHAGECRARRAACGQRYGGPDSCRRQRTGRDEGRADAPATQPRISSNVTALETTPGGKPVCGDEQVQPGRAVAQPLARRHARGSEHRQRRIVAVPRLCVVRRGSRLGAGRSSPGPRSARRGRRAAAPACRAAAPASPGRPVADPARRDEHRPAQLERVPGAWSARRSCAAPRRRSCASDSAAMIRLRRGYVPLRRVRVGMVLADHRAAACARPRRAAAACARGPGWQCPAPITPTVAPPCSSGGRVRRAVDADRQPRHDRRLALDQPAGDARRQQAAGRRGAPRADDADCARPAERGAVTQAVDHRRRRPADRAAARDSRRRAA